MEDRAPLYSPKSIPMCRSEACTYFHSTSRLSPTVLSPLVGCVWLTRDIRTSMASAPVGVEFTVALRKCVMSWELDGKVWTCAVGQRLGIRSQLRIFGDLPRLGEGPLIISCQCVTLFGERCNKMKKLRIAMKEQKKKIQVAWDMVEGPSAHFGLQTLSLQSVHLLHSCATI